MQLWGVCGGGGGVIVCGGLLVVCRGGGEGDEPHGTANDSDWWSDISENKSGHFFFFSRPLPVTNDRPATGMDRTIIVTRCFPLVFIFFLFFFFLKKGNNIFPPAKRRACFVRHREEHCIINRFATFGGSTTKREFHATATLP